MALARFVALHEVAEADCGAVAACRPDSRPQPLGDCDAALLNRFD